jgi:multicomponent K+:H+ antiporter subunit A
MTAHRLRRDDPDAMPRRSPTTSSRRPTAKAAARNVVNVILVDFRGFDTLGEITVLGIVALTVFALLRRFRPASDSVGSPEQQRIQNAFDEAQPDREAGDTASDYLLVPSVIMQWLFPVIIVFAAYLFLRGHDLPGGGFAAGIAMAAAFILQYMAAGTAGSRIGSRSCLSLDGAGLLMAAATGAGSWLFGYPFLTSHSRYVDLPLIGEVPLASALLFDLGVFSLVVGATVLMLIALAHQSIRRHRVRTASAALEEKA